MARGEPAYGTAVGIFTSPDGVLEGSGEASLRHCGRNLYVSGWGGGWLGGSQPIGTAVGIFTSPDGMGEGSGEASLRHCGRKLYVSGWGAGRLWGSQPTVLREREREREREGRDVAWQHTHPCRETPPQARTWLPAHAPPKGQRWERERREKEGTWRGNTRTPAVGHHPRQGRGYQRTHPRKDRDESERERERERERGRDVAWQHTHPCRGTPPQARTWLPAHAPPKGQRGEREREREREKEGTWRGNTRTPAVGHHPRQGRGYQRTHPRKDRDETGWGGGWLRGSQPTALRKESFHLRMGRRRAIRGEASLRHCGRNLYVSGWDGGGLGGKPAYGTAVGIFTSPDGVGEG